jgi:hypothetical protein
LLIQLDHGGLRVRPQLRRGRPKGVGGLQRVPALDAPAAAPAAADVDVELPVDGRARDLDLVLVIDVGLVYGAAAARAGGRQGGLVDFVDLGGGQAMGLGAVVGAGLAAGLLRVGLGRSLGERCGLALAGTLLLFEEAGEPLDVGFQLGDAALQGLAAGAVGFSHAGMVGKRRAASCAPAEKSNDRARRRR